MSSIHRILITGGSGMVGSQIPFGIKPPRAELDILDETSIRKAFKKYGPQTVLHLAALTDLNTCEIQPEDAYEINVIGTCNVAKICRKEQTRLVFFSTCAVFDGKKKTPYTERDVPNPINVYGRTKRIGELIIADLLKNFLIIRTGWLFGGQEGQDKKFVRKCITMLKEKKKLYAVRDRYGSPTYVPDLIKKAATLVSGNTTGIIHVINSGPPASYVDIARTIKKAGNFQAKIYPITERKKKSGLLLSRGRMEGITSEQIKMRPWKEAVKEYVVSLESG